MELFLVDEVGDYDHQSTTLHFSLTFFVTS